MPELQKLFLEFFESLGGAEKDFMRDALSYREYNVVKDRQLLASETAAYLLQQPPGETDRYFREYVLPWYAAYHGAPAGNGKAEPSQTEPSPAVSGFLMVESGIFGRRAAALQERFEAAAGLRAEIFFDLLPKNRRL
jgi:hypothetical protein